MLGWVRAWLGVFILFGVCFVFLESCFYDRTGSTGFDFESSRTMRLKSSEFLAMVMMTDGRTDDLGVEVFLRLLGEGERG